MYMLGKVRILYLRKSEHQESSGFRPNTSLKIFFWHTNTLPASTPQNHAITEAVHQTVMDHNQGISSKAFFS